MIIDSQTNFVYLADSLHITYPKFAKDFVLKLKENEINLDFLPGTKDVWAVDYMPIQVSENKFIRFSYKSDYLTSTKKWAKTISDVDGICQNLGIKTIKSDIILDGGNIIKWENKILMTTKIFFENRGFSELQLIEELKNILEINEIIFVPIEKDDWLGHADGKVRFLDSETVLINEFDRNDPNNFIDFLSALNNAKLNWKTIPNPSPFNLDTVDASGLYLNYLELENHQFLPIFEQRTDQQEIDIVEELFPGKKSSLSLEMNLQKTLELSIALHGTY